jgi:hypothetical protein
VQPSTRLVKIRMPKKSCSHRCPRRTVDIEEVTTSEKPVESVRIGRIGAMYKQVILQKIRDAERDATLDD